MRSTMPSDSMDDIELKNIQLQFPALRYLSRDDSSVREERVETDKGSLLVAVQGNRAKPPILTYHDLGLNCKRFTIEMFNVYGIELRNERNEYDEKKEFTIYSRQILLRIRMDS